MLKHIKEILEHRKQIFEGVKNSVLKKKEVEDIAQKRLSICEECPLIDREGSKCVIPGTKPCCGECGCKLSLKTRSLSSECPHPDGPKWHAILDQKEEDKLYKDIEYDPDKE